MNFFPPTALSKDLKLIFDLFDRDEDGSLNFQDLVGIMKALGQDMTEPDIHALLKELPGFGGGNLTIELFVALMTMRLQDTCTEQELLDAFSIFDRDGNGEIPLEDFRYAMSSMGKTFPISPESLEDFCRGADNYGDRIVRYKELVKKMLNQ